MEDGNFVEVLRGNFRGRKFVLYIVDNVFVFMCEGECFRYKGGFDVSDIIILL